MHFHLRAVRPIIGNDLTLKKALDEETRRNKENVISTNRINKKGILERSSFTTIKELNFAPNRIHTSQEIYLVKIKSVREEFN